MAQARKSPHTRKKPAASRKAITTKATSSRLAIIRKHAIESLLGVAPHAHTGKRIHRRHTSHGFLLTALLLTGVLLFSNLGSLQAFAITKAGAVNVSVNVLGNPPTVGAIISFPVTNSVTAHDYVTVTGSCPSQTLVSIYNNAIFAGSSACTSSGSFSISITLIDGTNILQAQNYDGLDQPGPATPSVIIVKETAPPVSPISPIQPTDIATTLEEVAPQKDPVVTPTPSTPAIPDKCAELDESPVTSADPVIAVGCIQRNVFAGETLSMPLLIKGGLAPFALAVDWGDEKQDLVTVLDSKKKVLAHTYATGGFHQITLKATDSGGGSTQLQTTVSVNGEVTTGTVVTNIDKIMETAKSIWVEAPVPLYFTALALAIGFWVGDIFERMALAQQPIRHRSTRRHA